jgi:hypothetical protein
MLTYKLDGSGSPLPMTEADSRVAQFMKSSMALVDLLQRDHELSSMERACMDNYLRLIELSYSSWKRRTDRIPPPQKATRPSSA